MSTCPKCNHQLRHVSCIGSGSTLHRQQQGGCYSGMSCINCGTWIDDGLQIVKPLIVEKQRRPTFGGRPQDLLGHVIHAEVTKNWPAIFEMRANKRSMNAIKKDLSLSGSPGSIRKHIMSLEAGCAA
jgi:hypothetical protein